MNARRYRENQSRPIPVWNGILEHRQRIDSAVWVFLWCLDAITEERDGVGIVRGGAPVKASLIAADLSFDEWTVRQHLQTLVREHYIQRRRTPYGFRIEVVNSRKFGIWKAHERSGENPRSEAKRSVVLQREIGENPRNKEDAAKGTQQKDAASSSQPPTQDLKASVWGFLEISPCGPPPFRALLESQWASRNGGPYSVLIGETIDAWEAAEGQKPRQARQLFAALAKLREQERQNPHKPAVTGEPIHTFKPEEIPA